MLMDPLPVAQTVQKYFQYGGQVTVCDFKSVVSDDNNYASDMTRICLKIKAPEGGYRKVSVIVKESLMDRIVTEAVQVNVHFSTEFKAEVERKYCPLNLNVVHQPEYVFKKVDKGYLALFCDYIYFMYCEVLPMMEQLVHEFPIYQDTLWPHCLGHLDEMKIVLEDLQDLGYRMGIRETGLDYDEASIAIKCLARFHALSVILVNKELIHPDEFSYFVFGGDFQAINELIVNSFKSLHQAMCTHWSQEWKDIIDRLGKLSEVAVEQLKQMRSEDTKLKVLNHGDPWVNNIMFKYSNSPSSPESVKLVDFQLSHYDSFAFDLHYFLSTSVSYEVLFMFDRLILEYTETLGKCLRNMGHMEVPTFSDVMNEMKRTEFFGLFAAVTVTPIVCAPPQFSPPKINKTDMSVEEMEIRKTARFTTPEYTKRLEIILRRAQHGGLLQRICP